MVYLDASAYVKAVLCEAGHDALLAELSRWDGYVSSSLLGTESVRACSRYGAGYAGDARAWLLDVALLPVDDRLLDEAAGLGPAGLRSLDALHLATALSIREELGAFACYDDRLSGAAMAAGLPVIRPDR